MRLGGLHIVRFGSRQLVRCTSTRHERVCVRKPSITTNIAISDVVAIDVLSTGDIVVYVQ